MTSSTWLRGQLRDVGDAKVYRSGSFSAYGPLVICGGVFAFTILWALVGPISWDIDRPVMLYGFVGAYLVALVAGYVWATCRSRAPSTDSDAGRRRVSASALVIVGSVVSLIIFPASCYAATGKFYPDVVSAWADPGAAYDRKIDFTENASQLATYVGIALAPLTISVLPLTIFMFKRLSVLARVLGVMTIVATQLLGAAQAVNKDMAEICGFMVLFFGIYAVAGNSAKHLQRVGVCLLGCVVAVGVFFVYYDHMLTGRVAADVAEVAASSEDSKPDKDPEATQRALSQSALVNMGTVRDSSVFFSVAPAPVQPIGMAFTSYLTQGYQGLGLAMEQPFETTYGLGFSEFGRHNVLRLAGAADREDEVVERSYVGKIDEQGWTAGQYWSTFFIYPASDIGFLGVIPFMLLVGFAFGASWRDVRERNDAVACTVFVYLCILVFYLCANNQIYQGGRLAVGFTFALVAWLWLRRSRSGRSGDPTVQAGA